MSQLKESLEKKKINTCRAKKQRLSKTLTETFNTNSSKLHSRTELLLALGGEMATIV